MNLFSRNPVIFGVGSSKEVFAQTVLVCLNTNHQIWSFSASAEPTRESYLPCCLKDGFGLHKGYSDVHFVGIELREPNHWLLRPPFFSTQTWPWQGLLIQALATHFSPSRKNLRMHMGEYVYAYKHLCLHVYMYICIYVYMSIYVYACKCLWICICICVYMYKCIYVYRDY